MKLKIIIFMLVVVANLSADYIFLSNPIVEDASGGTQVTSGGKLFLMNERMPVVGKQSRAFVLSEDIRSKNMFRLVDMLYPETLESNALLRILPEIKAGEKISEKRVMAAITALIESSEVNNGVKYEFINCFSREIYGQERWEQFFNDLFVKFRDAPEVDYFLPLLCRNGVQFHSRIKLDSTLTDIMLRKIVGFSPYNDRTRHIYIEGLKRKAPEVNFVTLDRLRGAADIHVVDAVKNLALSEESRIQWAALMCLSTALERPIEAPSLADYIAEPQKFFDALAPILLKK